MFTKEENKKIIIITIFLIVIKIAMSIAMPIYMDSSWCYTVCKYMASNLIIYKDFNCLSTPFYYILFSIPLKIYDNFYVFRLFELIPYIFEIIILYKINSKYFSFNTCLIMLSVLPVFNIYIDYNTIVIIIALLAAYILLKEKLSFKNNFVLGIVCSLLVMTKQTMGFLFSVVIFIFLLLFFENKIKNTIALFSGVLSAALIFIIYFLCTNSLIPFFDNCLFGASSFTYFLYLWETKDILLIGLILLINIILLILTFKFQKRNKNIILFGFFSIISSFFIMPIINEYHLKCSIFFTFLWLCFLLNDFIKNNKYINYVYKLILVMYFCILGCIFTYNLNNKYIKNDTMNTFYDKDTIELFEEINSKNIDSKKIISLEPFYSSYSYSQNIVPDKNFYVMAIGNTGQSDVIKNIDDYMNKGYIFVEYKNDKDIFLQLDKKWIEHVKTYNIVAETENLYFYAK